MPAARIRRCRPVPDGPLAYDATPVPGPIVSIVPQSGRHAANRVGVPGIGRQLMLSYSSLD